MILAYYIIISYHILDVVIYKYRNSLLLLSEASEAVLLGLYILEAPIQQNNFKQHKNKQFLISLEEILQY